MVADATTSAFRVEADERVAGYGLRLKILSGTVQCLNHVFASRKARTMAIVAVGFSSMIQWPESGITPSRTLLAANRMIFAIVVPNDFSPPIASTGMGSLPFDGNCWLSVASWSNAANCMKPECIAPGMAYSFE